MSYIGRSSFDDDPRVAQVIAEYETFYQTGEGQALDAALASREAFAALPDSTKDRAEALSYALHMARREVRSERKVAHG
jgi:hypothetical protein